MKHTMRQMNAVSKMRLREPYTQVLLAPVAIGQPQGKQSAEGKDNTQGATVMYDFL